MKLRTIFCGLTSGLLLGISSCSLDYEPLDTYSDVTEGVTSDGTKIVFKDKARQIQALRYKDDGILTNSELTSKLIKKYCQIDKNSETLLKTAAVKYQLSGRRYDRILKLARTIADLDCSENIQQTHLMQALQYRMNNKD